MRDLAVARIVSGSVYNVPAKTKKALPWKMDERLLDSDRKHTGVAYRAVIQKRDVLGIVRYARGVNGSR